MDYIFKEVYFDNFCAKCVHKEKEEWEEPCGECLDNPVNRHVNYTPERMDLSV